MKGTVVARRAWALGCALVASSGAWGQLIPGYPPNIDAYDPREVAMLPRYCIYTQSFREKVPGGNDPATIEKWYAEMGEPFHAMHHYCYGLMKTNRATLLAKADNVRTFYLNDAIMEYDYVITRVPDSFVLMPEMLTKKGQNLLLLGKDGLAIIELERAIQVKKDYWPPYAYLSDYYRGVGNLARARELLEEGLRNAPDAKALQRRLAELPAAGVAPVKKGKEKN